MYLESLWVSHICCYHSCIRVSTSYGYLTTGYELNTRNEHPKGQENVIDQDPQDHGDHLERSRGDVDIMLLQQTSVLNVSLVVPGYDSGSLAFELGGEEVPPLSVKVVDVDDASLATTMVMLSWKSRPSPCSDQRSNICGTKR